MVIKVRIPLCEKGKHKYKQISFETDTVMNPIMGEWFKAMRCKKCGHKMVVQREA